MTFLVSQVGAASSSLWDRRLQEAGLDSRSAMLIWNVASAEGRSQRELAEAMRLPPTRLVEIVDRMQQRGWIERRVKAGDRRTHELYLTKRGGEVLERIMTIAGDYEENFAGPLEQRERAELVKLLTKLAAGQGLIPRVHPDF